MTSAVTHPEPHPGPGPLLRADVEPRRGPPPVRHRRQGLPRLRQRDRGHGAGPRPSAGHRRDPRPGRPADRPDQRDGVHRADLATWRRRSRRRSRQPLDSVMFLNSGLGGDRRGAQARPPGDRPARDHRVPWRLPRPDVGRDQSSPPRTSTTAPATSRCCPGVLLRPLPGRLPRLRRRRGSGRRPRRPRGAPRALSPRSSRRRRSAAIVIEPVQGEGGYIPAPASFLRALRALCDRARHPAHRRRGPDRLRADRAGCGRSSTPGSSPTSCAWPRRSPTACRCRRSSRRASSRSAGGAVPTARRTAGTRSPAPPASRSSRRSATRAWWPTRRPAAPSSTAGLGSVAAEDDRIGDIRGRA